MESHIALLTAVRTASMADFAPWLRTLSRDDEVILLVQSDAVSTGTSQNQGWTRPYTCSTAKRTRGTAVLLLMKNTYIVFLATN